MPLKRERQSGLLAPKLGINSRDGFFIQPRFYWAINESQDMTFVVDYLEKRGLRPNWEYRYLLSVFYVPDWGYDDVYVIEAGGKAAAFDRHRAAVDQFIARLSLH